MKRLAILGVALVLATPGVGAAQFRTIIPVGGFGYGWPGYGGYGGYGYPYTFGGTAPYSWPNAGYSYGYANYGVTPLTDYSISNVGMPWMSLGGLPARWNGVDLTGTGNLATPLANYATNKVTTPRSGTLPVSNPDRVGFVPGDVYAHIRVRVPDANAAVTFEGQPVRLNGGVGRFVSPGLEPGSRYVYEVRARWTDAAGRRHNEGRSVVVRAGQHVDVSFVPPRR